MTGQRSRYGLLVSALGASVLVASVFLPWYAARIASGTPSLLHHGGQLSGRAALGGLAVALIVLAALALLDALFPIARAASIVPEGAGGAVVVLGIVAGALVLYRMIDPPVAAGALGLGCWMALLGSLTVALGGLWPRELGGFAPAEAFGADIWSTLSGWTSGS